MEHQAQDKAVAAEPNSVSQYLGFWEATKPDRTIGTVIYLREGGKCDVALVQMKNWRYALQADVMHMFDEMERLQIREVGEVSSESWVQRTVDGVIRRTRIGSSPDGGLIMGIWSHEGAGGLLVYENYQPDGRLVVRTPLGSQRNSWSVKDDATIVIHGIFEGGSENGPARLGPNGLELVSSSGRVINLVKATAWYPLDQKGLVGK